MVPKTCLNKCQFSGAFVLKHLLVESELSERLALPEFTVLCTLSGERIICSKSVGTPVDFVAWNPFFSDKAGNVIIIHDASGVPEESKE